MRQLRAKRVCEGGPPRRKSPPGEFQVARGPRPAPLLDGGHRAAIDSGRARRAGADWAPPSKRNSIRALRLRPVARAAGEQQAVAVERAPLQVALD